MKGSKMTPEEIELTKTWFTEAIHKPGLKTGFQKIKTVAKNLDFDQLIADHRQMITRVCILSLPSRTKVSRLPTLYTIAGYEHLFPGEDLSKHRMRIVYLKFFEYHPMSKAGAEFYLPYFISEIKLEEIKT